MNLEELLRRIEIGNNAFRLNVSDSYGRGLADGTQNTIAVLRDYLEELR